MGWTSSMSTTLPEPTVGGPPAKSMMRAAQLPGGKQPAIMPAATCRVRHIVCRGKGLLNDAADAPCYSEGCLQVHIHMLHRFGCSHVSAKMCHAKIKQSLMHLWINTNCTISCRATHACAGTPHSSQAGSLHVRPEWQCQCILRACGPPQQGKHLS